MKLKAFFELTRFEHGIMYGVAVIIGAILAGFAFEFSLVILLPLIFGFLTALFIEMGAFALNDYYDLPADKINKRIDRPLVRGEMSRKSAYSISMYCFVLGNLLSLLISIECFAIAFAFTLLSILYNRNLKKSPVVGNLFIGITMAVPFVFGSVILGKITDPVSVLAGISFIVGVGREIMKDIQDLQGDKAMGAKTLPTIVGAKKTTYSIVTCYIIGIALSIIPFLTFFKTKPFYSLILVTDLLFILVSVKILKDQGPKTLKFGRKWTLAGSAIALLAFLLAAVT